MSKRIKLSEKYGVNPTIPVCFWCGESKNEIALLGRLGDARKGEDIEAPKNMVLDYEPCDKCKEKFTKYEKTKNDIISHPFHYTAGRKYEPKDVIRDWELNFNLGSAVKYISRAGRKDDIVQDLKKAKQFIQFEIDYLEENK